MGRAAIEMGGGGGLFTPRRRHGLDAVARQPLERGGEGRYRQRVGIEADEQRAVDAVLLTVVANGLSDRKHMGFVEAQLERTAAMTGRAEGHSLCIDRGIRALAEIGGYQSRHVHQALRRGGLTGQWVDTRAHDVVTAALLSAMLRMSSLQDLT